MDPELEAPIAAAAARGTASLRAGANLGELLRTFREDDQLGWIGSILALLAIEHIPHSAAKHLVQAECAGESFAHLGLEELQHLAHIPRLSNIGSWLPVHLELAIIDGRSWRLFVPDAPGSVLYFEAEAPDPSRAGSMSWDGLSLDEVRDETTAALSEPGWDREVRIVRDEPDLFLVHFPRVREKF